MAIMAKLRNSFAVFMGVPFASLNNNCFKPKTVTGPWFRGARQNRLSYRSYSLCDKRRRMVPGSKIPQRRDLDLRKDCLRRVAGLEVQILPPRCIRAADHPHNVARSVQAEGPRLPLQLHIRQLMQQLVAL